MIVANLSSVNRRQGPLRMVTQNDHAHLSAEILRFWCADDLPQHPRRATILLAAREHDNGWREHDAAPRIEPESGRPRDFRMTAEDDRQTIWQRGVDRHRITNPSVALLVLTHARRLHADREGAARWRPLLESWRERSQALADDLGLDAETIAADYHFVDLADTISLALADRWQEPFTFRAMRFEPRPAASPGDVDTLAIEPFPFAGATTFALPCRMLERASFASDMDLALALAEARWTETPVRLAPADPTRRVSS